MDWLVSDETEGVPDRTTFIAARGIRTEVRSPPGCQAGNVPSAMRRRMVESESPATFENSANVKNCESAETSDITRFRKMLTQFRMRLSHAFRCKYQTGWRCVT